MVRQNVWDRINGKQSKEVKIEVLLKLLRAMDYKLVIMPINRKTPEDGFEVDETE